MFMHIAAAAVLIATSTTGREPDPKGDVPAPAPLSTPVPSKPDPADSPTPAMTDPAKPVEGSEPKPDAATISTDAGVPYPHPIITEVLFAVPGGDTGDANGDGKRHVSGDEFVELFNPHDKPIQLRGYKLTDSNAADKGQLRFVFPMLELAPGATVVVFNGFQCSWFGPVGDEKAAPPAGNERFGNAWVFTMKAASQYVAFSNSGDHVLLAAPDGTAVHRVSWGESKDQSAFDKLEPLLDDVAMQTSKASVQRDSLSRVASFRAHIDLPFANGGEVPFSPGRWKALPEPKAKKQVEEGPDNPPTPAK